MIDPEFKERWASALESGKYAQGVQALRSSDKHFCCLGVGCDLIDPNAWEFSEDTGEWRWHDLIGDLVPAEEPAHITLLFPPGLDMEAHRALTEMNDDGWDPYEDDQTFEEWNENELGNFPRIARWIRENL